MATTYPEPATGRLVTMPATAPGKTRSLTRAAQADFAGEQMVLTRNYDLVATILFQNSFGKGHFYLFRLALNPGHGNFTSLKQLKTTDWGT
jgi:hypothetical protein